MKTCKECGHTKEFSEFSVRNSMVDGFLNKCKSCVYAQVLARRRTKKGLVKTIYNDQKGSSKKRGHTPPTYTEDELRQFFRDSPIANRLYREWKLSGYAKNMRPSVDRLDDSYGYTLGNIQLTTWGENNAKACADRESGRMENCTNEAVVQYDLDGNFIAEYHSQSEAARVVGVDRQGINSCCNGRRKSTGKFQWKLKGKSND